MHQILGVCTMIFMERMTMTDINRELLNERFGDYEKLKEERVLTASQISKYQKSN
jgi:hypothetical protein